MTKDRELQEEVLKALDYEPGIEAAGIGVAVDHGVVTLGGRVASYHQKWVAEEGAGRVRGVKAIANDIEVAPDTTTTPDDSAIAGATAAALFWNTSIPANAVRATVTDGWIMLSGTVTSQYERRAAERAVRHLRGVKGVTNAITLKAPTNVADIKTKIEEAFERNAVVDARRLIVETRNGEVTLKGTVRSIAERLEAERTAWAAPGVVLVDDRLVVVP